MSLLLQSMNIFVCCVLRSHEIRGPHFMDFQCLDDLTSVAVIYLGIDWSQNPETLDNFISTKFRVQLVDLPKTCCEQSVFSAPRQRMSVVEGREVIVGCIKKRSAQ